MAPPEVKIPVVQPPKFWPTPGAEPELKWSVWEQTLVDYFALDNENREVPLEDRQKNLITKQSLGNAAIKTFAVHPEYNREANLTHAAYLTALRNIFGKAPNAVLSHFYFSTRKQSSSELVADFLLALKTLAADCDFHGHTDYFIAIQLAVGCYSKEGQHLLLTQRNINLAEFTRILEAQESSAKDQSHIRGESRMAIAATKQAHSKARFAPRGRETGQQRAQNSQQQEKCNWCGKQRHTKVEECPARGKKCSKCGKLNHFAIMCLSGNSKTAAPKRVKTVRLPKQATNADSKRKPRIALLSQNSTPNFCSTIGLEAGSSGLVSLSAEVDSCSDVTGVPYHWYRKHFVGCKLHSAPDAIMNFDRSPIQGIRGSFQAEASFKGRTATLQVHVLPNSCEAVIGKDAIHALHMVLEGGSAHIHAIKGNPTKMGEAVPQSSQSVTPSPSANKDKSSAAMAILQGLSPKYQAMLRKYPGLLKDEIGLVPKRKHTIETERSYRIRTPMAHQQRGPVAVRMCKEKEPGSKLEERVGEGPLKE